MKKMGLHALPDLDLWTLISWLNLRPSVSKFANVFGLSKYALDGTLCIGRKIEGDFDIGSLLDSDPETEAHLYFDNYIAQNLIENPRIDVWEGPNEQHPASPEAFIWYSNFLWFFAKIVAQHGKRAGIGNWSEGTPEIENWKYCTVMLQAVKAFNAVLCRHEYGPLDSFHCLRYQRDNIEFAKLGFPNLPLVITEFGADYVAGQTAWKGAYWGGSMPKYWDEEIEPYMGEISKDGFVLGATLYSVGKGETGDWKEFDVSGTDIVERINNWEEPDMPDDATNAKIAEHAKAILALVTPAFLFRIRILATVLNVRSGPGTTFAKVGEKRLNDILEVYKISPNSWYQINPTEDYWISGLPAYSVKI